MSFFSEERASELRELFFESAQELLQALNEEGLELEKRPQDAEIIRTTRRTVHTLKGDSAACGFRELSELAHELEDVLTPEIAARAGAAVAQVVLSAADLFDAMLVACRGKQPPPDAAALRAQVRGLAENTAVPAERKFAPQFAWSEYDRLVIQKGADGRPLFNVGVEIDPGCAMRSAAMQLVHNVLHESGSVLITRPEDGATDCAVIEAVVASDHDQQWIATKCRIPAVVSNVAVEPYLAGSAPATPTAPECSLPDPPQAADVLAAPMVGTTNAEVDTVEPALAPAHATSDNILRVDAERIDAVLNLVGELIIGKSMLHQTVNDFMRRFPRDPLRTKFTDLLAHQAQVLNELQRSVMKVRMVPVEQLFRRFPRVVRDVAKARGKDVVLQVSGQDTDLDKGILDALAEPLTHLVRNAVDHGIESPEERTAAGKPAQGTVRLDAYHQGNHVVIEVSDDGRGIDQAALAAKAVQCGLVTAEQIAHMSNSDVLELIFEPGFTTASEVTQVSGRGVGLDVVKTVLERMKATVSVHTCPGEGCTFQLKVPLTLAIIKALLFRVGDRLYAIPLAAVLEITRVAESEVHRVDGREVARLREDVLSLVRLTHLAGPNGSPPKKLFVIVVGMAGRKFGLMVEHLVGEEELVIKALNDQLVSSDLVSGASILGDGRVVLVLNIAAVVEKLGRVRGVSVDARAGDQRRPVASDGITVAFQGEVRASR
ncbi:MAG: chemotaxis protein CheA [Terriglobales bacterium]